MFGWLVLFGVLVSWVHHNKIPLTGRLKQTTKTYFSTDQGLGIQDQGVSMFGLPWEPTLQFALVAFSLYPHMASSVCAYISGVSSSTSKDISNIWLGPTHIIALNHKHFYKDRISKYNHILRYLGLGLQRRDFVATKLIHNVLFVQIVVKLEVCFSLSFQVR